MIKKGQDCENYFESFCLKDIGSGRIWDCTCFIKKIRAHQSWLINMSKFSNKKECPYPKLNKNEKN